jgi:protein arginine kinase activator
MAEEPQRPKGCEGCKKPCSVFFTQIVNGETGKVNMCSDCPMAKSLLDPAQLGLLSQLTGMTPTTPTVVAGEERCPVCGFTPAEFRKQNRLGCPHCYEYLSEFIGKLLPQAQAGREHHGKAPHHHEGMLARSRMKTARIELEEAVAKENFELAAKLRDEIRELEKRIDSENSAG